MQYPQYKNLLFAIPNGGSRHKVEAYNLKKQGVVPGVPDLMLATGGPGMYAGLFIEMKYGRNQLTPNQIIVMGDLRNQDYQVAVCRTFDEFKEVVEKYLD